MKKCIQCLFVVHMSVIAIVLLCMSGIGAAQDKLVIATGHGIPDNILDAFSQQHPGVEIEVLLYPSWEFDEKLLMLFLTGERVDVIFEWSVYQWTNYAVNGQLQDLRAFVDRDLEWMQAVGIHPLAYESGYVGDILAGVNIELRMGWSIFYNDQLLQEAGLARPPARWDDRAWDWDTFEDYVEKLAVRDAAGTPKQYGFGHFDDDLVIFNLAWMWDTDVLSREAYETGTAEGVILTQPEMIRAFQTLFETETKGASTANKNAFLQGNVGMWLGVGDFRDYDFPWGVTRAPGGPAGPVPMATWSSFLGIPFTAGNANGAWEFIKFMLNDGNMLRDDKGQWWRSGISRESWAERFDTASNSVLTKEKLLEFYMEGLTNYTRMSPRTTVHGAGEVRDPVWSQMRKTSGVSKENLSVSDALRTAEILINSAIADLYK